MTVKYGEMTDLVTPTISIDEYKPKIGEANETVVVAFEVAFEQPARDLSNLIETDIVDSLDVDISQGPNSDGNYMVFVELERNNQLFNKIMEIVKVASNVTAITEWKFSYYKGNESKALTEDNLSQSVLDSSEEYVLRYSNDEEPTNESLSRVKELAGL